MGVLPYTTSNTNMPKVYTSNSLVAFPVECITGACHSMSLLTSWFFKSCHGPQGEQAQSPLSKHQDVL
jgi:hypothetical protein